MKVAKKFNMLKSLKGNNNKGFSLVELIIIIAILAILVAILSPMYFQYVEDTQDDILRSAAEQVKSIVETEVALENLEPRDSMTTTEATIRIYSDDSGKISITIPLPSWLANMDPSSPNYDNNIPGIHFMGNEDYNESFVEFTNFVGDLGESDSEINFEFTISIPRNINGVANTERVIVISDLVEN